MIRSIILLLLLSYNFELIAQKKQVELVSKMNGSKLLPETLENITFWGYGYDNNQINPKITLPGPTLRFNIGDTVDIKLFNASPESHTIHWHGLDVDQENDGVGHTSQDVIPQDSFNYNFVCTNSGTYLYHCHVQTPLHLAMGMYGLFIVNGNNGTNEIYGHDTRFTKEFSFLLSEMNTRWNSNPLSPGDFALYEADYFMINGVSGHEVNKEINKVLAEKEDTLAFRFANIGYGSNQILFPEELEVWIVGSDGRKIPKTPITEITIYPGERYDIIALPISTYQGNISVIYYDLRNNNPIGNNQISLEIKDQLNLNEEEKFTPTTFSIYPNPSSNYIIANKILCFEKITLIDLYGKLQKVILEDSDDDHSRILINHLKPGMYILIYDGISQKFMKK